MWEGTGYTPLRVDLDPAQHPTVAADCRALPFRAASWDVLVFDPPHIPGGQTRMAHKPEYGPGYGLGTLGSVNEQAVADLFGPFLAEAARLLTPGGIVLAKLANITYWDARLWHTHAFWAAVSSTPGLRYCDELVKVRAAPMPWPPSHTQQYHTQSAHATWVVVRKGGCQGHGLARAVKPQQVGMFA